MNSEIVDEIIEELSSSLQRVETQSAALMDFVKEKGLATDDELAPYLERATAASSVRWRATRVRLAHLLGGMEKSERQAKEQEQSKNPKAYGKEAEPQNKSAKPESRKQSDKPSASGRDRDAEMSTEPKEQRSSNNAADKPAAQDADQQLAGKEPPPETTPTRTGEAVRHERQTKNPAGQAGQGDDRAREKTNRADTHTPSDKQNAA